MGVTYASGRDWAEDAIDEPWLVERSLSELNWDERSIAEFVSEYFVLKESNLARPTFVRRLKEMLGRRKLIEEDAWHERIRVPLYRFGAPRVNGASVHYSESADFFQGGYWHVKIFGVGAENSQTFDVATTNTFVAENGECKLVFVPVRLRVARVRVEEENRVLGTGIRAHVIVPKTKNLSFVRGRGCMTLPRQACQLNETPEEDLNFEFSADSGAAPHQVRRSWEMNIERQVALKLKTVDIEVGPVTRIQRIRRMALDISLPTGQDYLGYRAPGALWWVAP